MRSLATGVRVPVLEAGAGGRPLLLVHGFTGAKEDFGDWIDRFAAEGWWVVAPDLRGHGGADQPDDEAAYSLATFADDLLALADDLGWERFSLLGHSMGGMIAQELVLRRTGHVERLVLMDTHHGPVEGLDPATVALAVDVLRLSPELTELDALMSAWETRRCTQIDRSQQLFADLKGSPSMDMPMLSVALRELRNLA